MTSPPLTATPYELLGIGPEATRAELDAAYAAKRASYDPTRVANLGPEFAQLVRQRQTELAAAYAALRPAFTAPPRLAPEVERRRDWHVILVLVLLALLGASVPLLRNVAPPQRTVEAGGAEAAALRSQPAPDFQLQSTDRTTVRLSDYKGQIVLLNVWATWCPPCVRETPRLVRVYERYKGQGFVMLGVNMTFQDKADKVTTFAREQGISYPVLLDTDGAVAQQYAGRVMPTSYLIDREGKIVVTKVGEVDEAQLSEQVAALLRGEQVAP